MRSRSRASARPSPARPFDHLRHAAQRVGAAAGGYEHPAAQAVRHRVGGCGFSVALFCGAMLVQKDSLRRVVELCKAAGKRVVIGGPYVMTSAEHLPQADHIFLGEAETILPEFLRDLERGAPNALPGGRATGALRVADS